MTVPAAAESGAAVLDSLGDATTASAVARLAVELGDKLAETLGTKMTNVILELVIEDRLDTVSPRAVVGTRSDRSLLENLSLEATNSPSATGVSKTGGTISRSLL